MLGAFDIFFEELWKEIATETFEAKNMFIRIRNDEESYLLLNDEKRFNLDVPDSLHY